MKPIFRLLLAGVCSMLQACGGGGGGGIASAPAPATTPPPGSAPPANPVVARTTTIGAELPPTPATRAGTYDAIGVINKQAAAGNQQVVSNLRPGDLAITVEPATKTYTLVFADGVAPNLSQPARLSHTIAEPTYGHEYTVTTRFANGTVDTEVREGETATDTRPVSTGSSETTSRFWSSTGKQYVSYGFWESGSSVARKSRPGLFRLRRSHPANRHSSQRQGNLRHHGRLSRMERNLLQSRDC